MEENQEYVVVFHYGNKEDAEKEYARFVDLSLKGEISGIPTPAEKFNLFDELKIRWSLFTLYWKIRLGVK